jgi:hypothetical protein
MNLDSEVASVRLYVRFISETTKRVFIVPYLIYRGDKYNTLSGEMNSGLYQCYIGLTTTLH